MCAHQTRAGGKPYSSGGMKWWLRPDRRYSRSYKCYKKFCLTKILMKCDESYSRTLYCNNISTSFNIFQILCMSMTLCYAPHIHIRIKHLTLFYFSISPHQNLLFLRLDIMYMLLLDQKND